MRVALGAHRRRILRQLLTESVLMAAIGVAGGVVLAYGILTAIQAYLQPWLRWDYTAPEVVARINLPVLLVSGATALITGVLCGLWPALRFSRVRVSETTRSHDRRLAGTVRGRKAFGGLVAGQIALTLVLLAGAGSAGERLVRLLSTPMGFDPHHAMALGIPFPLNASPTWTARRSYVEQLRAKVAETSGVTMTAMSRSGPPPRNYHGTRFERLGVPATDQQIAAFNAVDPRYFALLRIPLLQGRLWTDPENHNGAHVAVINRTLAGRYFPNGEAIGQAIRLPDIEDSPPTTVSAANIAGSWLQIIGIVQDALNDGLMEPVKPQIFVPFTLLMGPTAQILVRSEVPPLRIVRTIQAQLAAVHPDQRIFRSGMDLDARVSQEPVWQRAHLVAWTLGLFAVLALALASVGLYSVVSYAVAQRTRELGIRMALGAQRGRVMRTVLASILWSVSGGVLAGLALTVALSRVVAAQVVNGDERDPMTLGAGVLLLVVVAGLGSALPAWRASKIEPMTALRCE